MILDVPMLKWDYVRTKKEEQVKLRQRSDFRQVKCIQSHQNLGSSRDTEQVHRMYELDLNCQMIRRCNVFC